MAVYIDDMFESPIGEYRGMKMSHMMADSTEELLEMAETLGLRKSWLQKKGTPREHFDVSKSKRDRAIRLGAIPVTGRQMVYLIWQREGRQLTEKELLDLSSIKTTQPAG